MYQFTTDMHILASHILGLQRNTQIPSLRRLYHFLQIIYLFAGYPYNIVIYGSVHL